MTAWQLTARYGFFAALATAANLLAQEFSIRIYAGAGGLYLAMILGTAAGLLCKYQLDKHFIFQHRTLAWHEDVRQFFIYTGTGVFTTLLFWAFELGFEAAFGGKTARYLGAVIGLGLGYTLKYRLDKHFVFNTRI